MVGNEFGGLCVASAPWRRLACTGRFEQGLHRRLATGMENVDDLEGDDDLVGRLLRFVPAEVVLRHYGPEVVLRYYKPEEVLAGLESEDALRHYGLDLLLRHLRDLTPAAQEELERTFAARGA